MILGVFCVTGVAAQLPTYTPIERPGGSVDVVADAVVQFASGTGGRCGRRDVSEDRKRNVGDALMDFARLCGTGTDHLLGQLLTVAQPIEQLQTQCLFTATGFGAAQGLVHVVEAAIQTSDKPTATISANSSAASSLVHTPASMMDFQLGLHSVFVQLFSKSLDGALVGDAFDDLQS